MDVGRQKLKQNCDFEVSVATLTREMDVGRQKLKQNCDFGVDAEVHSKQYCRHLSSVDMVLRSFFGDCVL